MLITGEDARAVGEELRGILQDLLRTREGEVKDFANQAIAESLKDGKAVISASSLLKPKPASKPGE